MITLGGVELDDDLLWVDEWDDQAVSQAVRRRLDGGLAVYPRAQLAGRPVTLDTGSDGGITRAQALALQALAAVPGQSYALAFDARPALGALTVLFRWQDAPVLDLRPWVDYADPADEDLLSGQIRLMTA